MTESRQPVDLSAKHVGQCKICKLGKSDPDFLKYLYQLRFDLNLPLNEVARLANNMLRDIGSSFGRKLPELNIQNLSTHFQNHVPVELANIYRVQVSMGRAREQQQINSAPVESVERVEHAINLNDDEEINTYQELSNLYRRRLARLNSLPVRGDLPLSSEEVDLGDQMTRILGQLNRMKQTEKMISVIVHALLSKFTEGIMLICLTELEATKLEMSQITDDVQVRDRLIESLRTRLGRGFIATAENTLRDIKQRYPVAALQ